MRDISQLTYRLSAAGPQQCEPAVAMLVVGENRLSFATDKLPLTLKTAHGTITLPAGGIVSIERAADDPQADAKPDAKGDARRDANAAASGASSS